jgi:hypothetical protein
MAAPTSSPRPRANPQRTAPMRSPRPKPRPDRETQAIWDRSARFAEQELRDAGMKKGGRVKRMAKGGMCRGMGAATRGGNYRTS